MTRHKVLIPLDGSEFSRQALPYVSKLLLPASFDVTLLRVAGTPEGFTSPPARPVALSNWVLGPSETNTTHPIYQSQVWDALKAELRAELESDVGLLASAGFNVDAQVRFGDAADEIIALVESEAVSLVVMVTHGRSGLGRLLMGSVAEAVLRRSRVPVMMVRPVPAGDSDTVPAGAHVSV
ncbi:MAG: universal stress protein [Deinococcales bacterium]